METMRGPLGIHGGEEQTEKGQEGMKERTDGKLGPEDVMDYVPLP